MTIKINANSNNCNNDQQDSDDNSDNDTKHVVMKKEQDEKNVRYITVEIVDSTKLVKTVTLDNILNVELEGDSKIVCNVLIIVKRNEKRNDKKECYNNELDDCVVEGFVPVDGFVAVDVFFVVTVVEEVVMLVMLVVTVVEGNVVAAVVFDVKVFVVVVANFVVTNTAIVVRVVGRVVVNNEGVVVFVVDFVVDDATAQEAGSHVLSSFI
jgi:hypothetical protein